MVDFDGLLLYSARSVFGWFQEYEAPSVLEIKFGR
jgi:hypothetical protein